MNSIFLVLWKWNHLLFIWMKSIKNSKTAFFFFVCFCNGLVGNSCLHVTPGTVAYVYSPNSGETETGGSLECIGLFERPVPGGENWSRHLTWTSILHMHAHTWIHTWMHTRTHPYQPIHASPPCTPTQGVISIHMQRLRYGLCLAKHQNIRQSHLKKMAAILSLDRKSLFPMAFKSIPSVSYQYLCPLPSPTFPSF